MADRVICKIVETEIDLALGLISAFEPSSRAATRMLQSNLQAIVGVGYGAGLALVVTIEEAMLASCAIQCLDKKWVSSEDRMMLCKIFRDCRPAMDLTYNTLKGILNRNPAYLAASRAGGASGAGADFVSKILLNQQLFEAIVCELKPSDLVKMLSALAQDKISSLVAELQQWITDNARLDTLDRMIQNAWDEYMSWIKDVEDFLILLKAIMDQCPLLCDLGDGLAKKLSSKKDLMDSMTTVLEAQRCYSVFSEENQALGWNGMRQLYQECKEGVRTSNDRCGMPFHYLCSIDEFVKGKLKQFDDYLANRSILAMQDCLTPIGGKEKVKKSHKDGFYDYIFTDEDKATMSEKEQETMKGAVNKWSKLGVDPISLGLELDCGESEDATEDKSSDPTSETAPEAVVPHDTVPTPAEFPPKPSSAEDGKHETVASGGAEKKASDSKGAGDEILSKRVARRQNRARIGPNSKGTK